MIREVGYGNRNVNVNEKWLDTMPMVHEQEHKCMINEQVYID